MRIGTRLLFVALLAAALAAGPPSASAQEDLFDLFDSVIGGGGGDEDRGQGQGVGQGGGPKAEGGGGGRGRGQGGGRGKQRSVPDRGVADILGDIGIDTADGGGGLGRGAIAMVDRITGAPGSSVGELDPVYEGDRIDLGDDGELVLEVFDSCTRERIRGGIVRVSATVLVMPKARPKTSPTPTDQPRNKATPRPSMVETAICVMAPGTISAQRATMSLNEKCRPTPNISRMTPISANCAARSASPTKPGV